MSNVIHITSQQGDTFTLTLESHEDDAKTIPTDYTGMGVNAQLRKSYNSASIDATFTTDITDNVITLSLTALETANLQDGNYVYDIKLTDNAPTEYVETLLRGRFKLDPEVTK